MYFFFYVFTLTMFFYNLNASTSVENQELIYKECADIAHIKKDDISVKTLFVGPRRKKVLRASQSSMQFKSVSDRLKAQGYTILDRENEVAVAQVGSKSAFLPGFGNREMGAPITVFQVTYTIKKEGKKVGMLFYLLGEEKEAALSFIKESDTIYGCFADLKDNKIQEFSLDKNNKITTDTDMSKDVDEGIVSNISHGDCKDVCEIVCGGGLYGRLTRCLARCAFSGPAMPECNALCITLVGLACWKGCDVFCKIVT